MPFKSEKQRKYLWANEPEIARDWTDTYGSGIQAAHGGRIPFAEGSEKTSIVEWNLANKKAELEFYPDTPENEEKRAEIQADIDRLEGNIGTTADTLLGSGKAPTKGIGSKILEFFLGSGAEGSESTAEERAAIERSSADIERRRDPQASYMENRPAYGYDNDWEGPIGATGRRPDKGGFIEYQEPFEHPYGVIGRRYSPEYLQRDAANKGFLTYETEHDPVLQRALINRNRQNLYGNEGIAAMDTDALEEERVNFMDALEHEEALKKKIRAQRSGPVIESDEEQEYINQGITGPTKWQQFLSKATRQPYRAATTGAGGYSAGQLNQMNALGGYYSGPAREQRQLGQRGINVLNRAAAAKPVGNVNQLLGQYGYEKSPSGGVTFTGGHEGSATAGAGYSRSDSGWERSPFNRGGMIGSVGGTSRQKYQQGEMVGAEMEGAEMGAEMEGAMMQSKEVIKELYDALIAQGLSPREAMEKIKQIIAGTQAQGPESPMMGEEFPGQEFGGGPRVPAAFGGIMDTYTGRRRYFLGSFNPFKVVKKAVKKLKKLASSKFGKIALGYLAGAGLANIGAHGLAGGTGGWGNLFKAKGWLRPTQVLSNIGGTGSRIGDYFSETFKPTLGSPKETIDMAELIQETGPLTQREKYIAGATKALKGAQTPTSLLSKIPGGAMTAIGIPSVAAGLYTAAQPPEELGGEVTEEYDDELQTWKDYYAGLNADYSVNPARLKSAQGGRIGRQEGGLMDLGGMEKDYRNDGGFVPLGGEEKADDVPARLSKNEFVFTADAVRNAGGGDIDRGAEVMENVMKNLEGGGQISEESQGQGAQEMFEVSERLSEVI